MIFRYLAFLCLVVSLSAAPTVTVTTPNPSATVSTLTSISIAFSEAVAGVDANDLQINNESATGVSGSGAGPYVFTFTQPPPGLVSLSWDIDHGIAGLGTGAFVPVSGWTYTLTDVLAPAIAKVKSSVAGQDQDAIVPLPGSTMATLTEVQVTFSEPVTGVDAADLLVGGVSATAVTGSDAGPYVFTCTPPPLGAVTLQWAAGHGIQDTAANPFAGGSWNVTRAASAGSVAINEILVSNASIGPADENGEFSDWIELFNSSASSVNLLGWSLSTSATEPNQWVFPSRTLNAGGYMFVYVSGKDRKPTSGNLHTNFRLNANGDSIYLFSPNSPRSAVSSFVDFPAQRYNFSYGPQFIGGQLRYFALSNPTNPGQNPSISALTAIAAEPTASVGRGFFKEPFSVILSTTQAAATIRYTLDGSVPLTTSTVYTTPLNVTATTVLRAATFSATTVPSATVTHSYIFLDNVFNQPSPPYDNPAIGTDNTNPQPPNVGGVPMSVYWGTRSGLGFPALITNLSTDQVPADYGMDPKVWNDPNKYDDNGNINAATGRTNLDRMKQSLRELPILSVTFKTDEILGPTGSYAHTSSNKADQTKACSLEMLLSDGTTAFAVPAGIDIHGNASRVPRNCPKRSFTIRFKGAYGAGKLEYPLFPESPAQEFDKLILRGDFNSSWCHHDNGTQRPKGTRIRDAWCKDTFRAMGRRAGQNRHLNLFLNGIYWGTYDLAEDEDDDFANTYFGGEDSDYDVYEQGVMKSGTSTAYTAMNSINAPIDNTKYEQMKTYLDIPYFVDYMLLHFYVGHEDWGADINKNWYAVRNRTANGTFKYLPWDMENLLWSESVNRVNVTAPPSGLQTKLVGNAQYQLDFADRVHAMMVSPDGALTPAASIARLNKWTSIMNAGAMALESARWGDYRRDVQGYSSNSGTVYTWNGRWFENNVTQTGTANWRTEILRLSGTYFPVRTNNVLGQLRSANTSGVPNPLYPSVNAPEIRNNVTNAIIASQQVAPGFVVKFTNVASLPSGTSNATTFYYTTNGADPRVYYAGTIDASAVSVAPNATLTINSTTTLKVRAFNGTVWSALNQQTFTVGTTQPAIRITELHYAPPAGQGGQASEFIEIQNTGVVPVDLSGWSFNGVELIVPHGKIIGPGDRMVFASNNAPAVFAAQFPGVAVSGYFGGSLNNAGETIQLFDVTGRLVTSVDYKSIAPWPTTPNGGGFTLEAINPDGDPNSPFNWKASNATKGTSGAANSPATTQTVTISEFLVKNTGGYTFEGATPGFVELLNSGGSDADVGNWQLITPEGGTFVIPGGTTLPTGGYAVIHFSPSAISGLKVSATLSEREGRIYLRNASGATIDGVQYGPQAANFSFARSGSTWTLSTPTAGAANATAATGAQSILRLNEWLANPAPGFSDWLELANTSAQPVVLTGMYVSTSTQLYRIVAPAAVAGSGYVQLFCNQGGTKGNNLDLNLPASGTVLTLLDSSATAVNSVTFTAQTESVSQGRIPNAIGSAVVQVYPSPGVANHAAITGAPILNEVLVTNVNGDNAPWAKRPGWVELRNTTAAPISIGGWSLRIPTNPDAVWTFPAGASVPAVGYLAIWTDPTQPASTTNGLNLNCTMPASGAALGSNGIELVNPLGQIADRITWGKQIADLSIGRLGDNSWALLVSPTRGTANQGAATLGPASAVRINEWYAVGTGLGTDIDYIELYNTSALPVALGGLFLADEPSEVGRRKYQFPPLTFIAGSGFVAMTADGSPNANATGYGLSTGGEYLRLALNDDTLLEAVGFGQQTTGTAQGRQPEGGTTTATFPGTPGAPNSTGTGPTITRHPSSIAAPGGSAVSLSIIASGATSYQWKRNGDDVPGGTAATLALDPLQIAHDGTYTCVATGPGGSNTSLPAKVTVLLTYELWADSYGLAGALRPGSADAEKDGLTNYEEFLANTNPLTTASPTERLDVHPVPGLEFSGNTPSFLTLDLRLNRRAAFSEMSGQISSDLPAGWTPQAPASVQILGTEPNGDQKLRLKFAVPNGTTQRFVRLTLTP